MFRFEDANEHPLQKQRLRELELDSRQDQLDEALRLVASIASGQNKQQLSLRRVDWMMTNYCKEHQDLQLFPKRWPGDENYGIIHDVYTNWRRNYKRKVFDPFRRSSTVYFEIDSKTIKSTVAQISFFWFLVVSGVAKTLVDRAHDVSEHQRRASEAKKKKQQPQTPPEQPPHIMLLNGVNLRLQM